MPALTANCSCCRFSKFQLQPILPTNGSCHFLAIACGKCGAIQGIADGSSFKLDEVLSKLVETQAAVQRISEALEKPPV